MDLLKLLGAVGADRLVLDIEMSPSRSAERWGTTTQNGAVKAIALSIQMNASDVADAIRLAEVEGQLSSEVAIVKPPRACGRPSTAPRRDLLADLTAREFEVLGLMAQGLSNAGIAHKLWITGSTVEKHVRNVMRRLDIDDGEDSHRRVLAVLAFLDRQRRSD